MYRHMASGVTSTGSHGENGSTFTGEPTYGDVPGDVDAGGGYLEVGVTDSKTE